MTSPPTVSIKRGNLHLSREVYDRYFAGLETVVLLWRADDLLILPVRMAAAGGYLLKLRNRAGDRVINAADFLNARGIGDDVELLLPVVWDMRIGGLIAKIVCNS